MTEQTNPSRYAIVAVCTIKGSNLENQKRKLWFGKSVAACTRAMVNLKEKYGSLYRDWDIEHQS